MLIRSTTARVVYAILFGVFVSVTSIVTGASPGWAIPLGIVTILIAFAAQTYYITRSEARQRR